MDSKATEPGLLAECRCGTGMLLGHAMDVVPSLDIFARASTAGKDVLCVWHEVGESPCAVGMADWTLVQDQLKMLYGIV